LYLFPLFLFDAAIFEEKVSRWDRLVLLETSFVYFVMIRDWLDSTNQGNALPQRRSKPHPHIALWNKTFLIEIVSAIFVHVRILMDEWGDDIDMFRLGLLPLERTFGALRQRS
jgi:hypothetical protein